MSKEIELSLLTPAPGWQHTDRALHSPLVVPRALLLPNPGTLQAKPMFQRQFKHGNFAIQPSKGNLIPFYYVNALKFLSRHR